MANITESPGVTHSDWCEEKGAIIGIFAHPDDETQCNGTLAHLASKGYDIHLIYATSGGGGSDLTGRGLKGNALASAREAEMVSAAHLLGIRRKPTFLRFRNGALEDHVKEASYAVAGIITHIHPQLIISYGSEGGVTGHNEHIATGQAVDMAVNDTDIDVTLLHMTFTHSQMLHFRAAEDTVGTRFPLKHYIKAAGRDRISAPYGIRVEGALNFFL